MLVSVNFSVTQIQTYSTPEKSLEDDEPQQIDFSRAVRSLQGNKLCHVIQVFYNHRTKVGTGNCVFSKNTIEKLVTISQPYSNALN